MNGSKSDIFTKLNKVDLGKLAFIPSHYELELRVILEGDAAGEIDTVPSKVRIFGESKVNTSQIVLEADELEIDPYSIKVSKTLRYNKSILTKLYSRTVEFHRSNQKTVL